jgi:hypothetical protein
MPGSFEELTRLLGGASRFQVGVVKAADWAVVETALQLQRRQYVAMESRTNSGWLNVLVEGLGKVPDLFSPQGVAVWALVAMVRDSTADSKFWISPGWRPADAGDGEAKE